MLLLLLMFLVAVVLVAVVMEFGWVNFVGWGILLCVVWWNWRRDGYCVVSLSSVGSLFYLVPFTVPVC